MSYLRNMALMLSGASYKQAVQSSTASANRSSLMLTWARFASTVALSLLEISGSCKAWPYLSAAAARSPLLYALLPASLHAYHDAVVDADIVHEYGGFNQIAAAAGKAHATPSQKFELQLRPTSSEATSSQEVCNGSMDKRRYNNPLGQKSNVQVELAHFGAL